MDKGPLYTDVLLFRQAIEKCSGDLEGNVFSNFPRGCCGDASELLAKFLEARNHGVCSYVCGLWFDRYHLPTSHAWLELGRYIIDITQDQFVDCRNPRLVTVDRRWHNSRFSEQERRNCSAELTVALSDHYFKILENVET